MNIKWKYNIFEHFLIIGSFCTFSGSLFVLIERQNTFFFCVLCFVCWNKCPISQNRFHFMINKLLFCVNIIRGQLWDAWVLRRQRPNKSLCNWNDSNMRSLPKSTNSEPREWARKSCWWASSPSLEHTALLRLRMQLPLTSLWRWTKSKVTLLWLSLRNRQIAHSESHRLQSSLGFFRKVQRVRGTFFERDLVLWVDFEGPKYFQTVSIDSKQVPRNVWEHRLRSAERFDEIPQTHRNTLTADGQRIFAQTGESVESGFGSGELGRSRHPFWKMTLNDILF